jgi:hypothetical protein
VVEPAVERRRKDGRNSLSRCKNFKPTWRPRTTSSASSGPSQLLVEAAAEQRAIVGQNLRAGWP